MSKIPEIISHYRRVAELGAGTYGTVHKAVHVHDAELHVAIKLVHATLATDPEFVSALRKECRVLAKLGHPGIVGFRDLVLSDDHPPAMVLELLEGHDLHERLQQSAPVSLAEVVSTLEQVLEALAYAHRKGVVHRDIKPSNVFLCSDGDVKLLDFGVARAADDSRATRTGQLLGTLDYIPPEVWHGNKATASADVYATGLVGWELLAGRAACSTGSLPQKMGWHLGVGASDPRQVRPDCPAWLAELVMELCHRDPEARAADGRQALDRLRALQQDLKVTASKSPLSSGRLPTPGPGTVMPTGPITPVSAPASKGLTSGPGTVVMSGPASLPTPKLTPKLPASALPVQPSLQPSAPPSGPATVGPVVWLGVLGAVTLMLAGGALMLGVDSGSENEIAVLKADLAKAKEDKKTAEDKLTEKVAEDQGPTEEEEVAAKALYDELIELNKLGQMSEAKAKGDLLVSKYAHTVTTKRAKRVIAELEVIGKKVTSSPVRIEKWFQGGPIDIRTGTKLVVFWEAWCPHSKKAVPELSANRSTYSSRGIELVTFTKVSHRASDKMVREVMADKGILIPVAKEDGSISREFNVSGVPAAALVKDGKIVWRGHPARLTTEHLDAVL